MGKFILPEDKHDLRNNGIEEVDITRIRTTVSHWADALRGLESADEIVGEAREKSRPHITRAMARVSTIHKSTVPSAYRTKKPFKAWYDYLATDMKPFIKHWRKITKGHNLKPSEITVPDYLYYYALVDLSTLGAYLLYLIDKAISKDTFNDRDADRFIRSCKVLSQTIMLDSFASYRNAKRLSPVFGPNEGRQFDFFNMQAIQDHQSMSQTHAQAHTDAMNQAAMNHDMMTMPMMFNARDVDAVDAMILGYFGAKIAIWLNDNYGDDRGFTVTNGTVTRSLMYMLADMDAPPPKRDFRKQKIHEYGPKFVKLKIQELELRAKLRANPNDTGLQNQLKSTTSMLQALIKRADK